MIKSADLPDTLAVFPLPGALLLPRAKLPLHVFEPRYLAMLDDTLKTPHRMIGMIQPNEALGAATNQLYQIGCAGRVTTFSETDEGRYMLTLSGVSRFRVVKETDGFTPYRTCDVSWSDFQRDLSGVEKDAGFDRTIFLDMLGRFFEDHSLKTDWESLQKAGDELLINSLSMLCPFASEDKQALLEAPTLTKRREILMTLIEFALRSGVGEDVMQ